MWALVRMPGRFVRPEWMTPVDPPQQDTLVRFTGSFEVPFEPTEGTLHTGTAFGCRVLVNGVEVGRQGGFDPYGFQMRVYRHFSAAFRRGTNTVTLEVHDPGQLVEALVDVRVAGAQGEEAVLTSGPQWTVQRGEGPQMPAALRRFQNSSWNRGAVGVSLDPQAVDLWRRPHPLPGADWLEDVPSDDTVVRAAPDAFGGQRRVEWLRWTLPPGVADDAAAAQCRRISAAVGGRRRGGAPMRSPAESRRTCRQVTQYGGRRSCAWRRQAGTAKGGCWRGRRRTRWRPGRSGWGHGREYGLASYSGGVRYSSTFRLDSEPQGRMVIDLGQVRGTAEVWVNGQPLGARIWAPYRFDITAAVQDGENRVEVLVLNTLAPYLRSTSPTNYVFGEQEVSGLMGPVRVIKAAEAA